MTGEHQQYPSDDREYSTLDEGMVLFRRGAELNWHELLSIDRVSRVEIVIGELACFCGEDVRLHPFSPGFSEIDGILSATRRLCNGYKVAPQAHNSSIRIIGPTSVRHKTIVADTLF